MDEIITSEDLIIELRKQSNYLKDIKNSDKKIDKKDNIFKNIPELGENTGKYITYSIRLIQYIMAIKFSADTIDSIIDKEYSFAVLNAMLALFLYWYCDLKSVPDYVHYLITDDDKKERVFKDKKEEKPKEKKTDRLDIIENQIEFLQSLTDEEKEQYLKLRF